MPVEGATPPPARTAAARARIARPGRAWAMRGAGIVLAAVLATLAGVWLQWKIVPSIDFCSCTYGDRVLASALFCVVLAAGIAAAVGVAAGMRPRRVALAAALGAAIGGLAAVVEGAITGFDSAPRRYLITIWVLVGIAVGIAATVTTYARRTVLAALAGAIGAGLGAGLTTLVFSSDDFFGETTFTRDAGADLIPATLLGLGIALAIAMPGVVRRRSRSPDAVEGGV